YHEFSSSIIYKKHTFNKIDNDPHLINNSKDYNDSNNEITDDNESNESNNNLDEYSDDEYNEFSLNM
ncbi:18314_t:CDS:1, partial [Funneliformis geosporum]